MALKKQITTGSGVVADYWYLHQALDLRDKGKVECVLTLYVSKTVKDADAQALPDKKTVLIDSSADGLTVAQIYTAIKSDEFFSDAVDV